MHTFTVLYLVFFFQISLHADSAEGESLETHPETENMTFIHFLMFTLSCLRLLLVQFPATSANLTISPWLLFECVCVCVCACLCVFVLHTHTCSPQQHGCHYQSVRVCWMLYVCKLLVAQREREREQGSERERQRETEQEQTGMNQNKQLPSAGYSSACIITQPPIGGNFTHKFQLKLLLVEIRHGISFLLIYTHVLWEDGG